MKGKFAAALEILCQTIGLPAVRGSPCTAAVKLVIAKFEQFDGYAQHDAQSESPFVALIVAAAPSVGQN